jgi:hypothetical protein
VRKFVRLRGLMGRTSKTAGRREGWKTESEGSAAEGGGRGSLRGRPARRFWMREPAGTRNGVLRGRPGRRFWVSGKVAKSAFRRRRLGPRCWTSDLS